MADQQSTRFSRRQLILLGSLGGAGLAASASPSSQNAGASASHRRGRSDEQANDDVSAPEDLMREHGVLKRVLLVYREAMRRLEARQPLPPDPLRDSARLIRTFIEDYHEKLEEDYLFPRFEKAGTLVDLIGVLRQQHQAGRRLTDRIEALATAQRVRNEQDAQQLREVLGRFVWMYEPHEAREDTVLFPALRRVVSQHELGALGEDFEKREHQLFGENGFAKMVDRVASIERTLGIEDLSQFTPKV